MDSSRKKSIQLYGGSTGTHMAAPNGRKKRRWPVCLICVVLVLVIFYLTAVYSQIPFIKHLRTVYIETAMSTMHHRWLATAFIPANVVNEVVDHMNKALEENMVPESKLPGGDPATPSDPTAYHPDITPPDPPDVANGLGALLEQFPELDPETIPEDIEDFHGLQIKDIMDMGIKTTAGDTVWAIDSPNNLLIVYVSGTGYKGKLVIVKDSAQVILGANPRASRGSSVTEICEHYGAVLGVNASGFIDPDGRGNGFDGVGLIISEGVKSHDAIASPYQICGLDYENNLRLGYKVDESTLRDAVQFYPIVVLNGERMNPGSFISNQPRTCIGQTSDRSMLLLMIEGRQLDSLGAPLTVCCDILLRYGCYNAMNMDGGSSSSITYMGEMITRTSSPMSTGRYLPDAWLVMPPSYVSEKSAGQ